MKEVVDEFSAIDFHSFSEADFANTDLLLALCEFVNQSVKKEGGNRKFEIAGIMTDVLYSVKMDGGQVLYATRNGGEVCGFIAGHEANFNKQDYQLKSDVPKGKYYYIHGLGNSTGRLAVSLGLVSRLLNGVNADYCFCSVYHNSPIYQGGIYLMRGWTEIQTSRPDTEDYSYFYIKKEEVIRK